MSSVVVVVVVVLFWCIDLTDYQFVCLCLFVGFCHFSICRVATAFHQLLSKQLSHVILRLSDRQT